MRIFTCAPPLLFDGIGNTELRGTVYTNRHVAPHRTVPYRTGCNSSSVNTVFDWGQGKEWPGRGRCSVYHQFPVLSLRGSPLNKLKLLLVGNREEMNGTEYSVHILCELQSHWLS